LLQVAAVVALYSAVAAVLAVFEALLQIRVAVAHLTRHY
jgi:hypothetical protein